MISTLSSWNKICLEFILMLSLNAQFILPKRLQKIFRTFSMKIDKVSKINISLHRSLLLAFPVNFQNMKAHIWIINVKLTIENNTLKVRIYFYVSVLLFHIGISLVCEILLRFVSHLSLFFREKLSDALNLLRILELTASTTYFYIFHSQSISKSIYFTDRSVEFLRINICIRSLAVIPIFKCREATHIYRELKLTLASHQRSSQCKLK